MKKRIEELIEAVKKEVAGGIWSCKDCKATKRANVESDAEWGEDGSRDVLVVIKCRACSGEEGRWYPV